MIVLLCFVFLILLSLFLAYYCYYGHNQPSEDHKRAQTIEKEDFNVNLDLIPNAKILKSVMLDTEKVKRPKRQENGLKLLGDKLRALSESNVHELTLYQDYMSELYSLDFNMLKKVLETQHYNVTTTTDYYGADLIVIRW